METEPQAVNAEPPNPTEQFQKTLIDIAPPVVIVFIPLISFTLFIALSLLAHASRFFSFFGYLYEFTINLAIFSTQFINYRISTFFSVFGIAVILMVVINIIYFSVALLKGKRRAIPLLILLVVCWISALELRAFKRECVANYNRVEAYQGQTVSFEKLQAECGKPAFYRIQKGRNHWGYTDGGKVIPIYITETGEANVSDSTYWLFD